MRKIIQRAYIGLKTLCDPAIEGNPYLVNEYHPGVREVKKSLFFLGKRRVAIRI